MIVPAVASEIRNLLEEGRLSQRKIARRVGASRGTVGAIARGTRPDYPARPSDPAEDLVVPTGPARRCHGCGAMVQMPCLACHIRAIRQTRNGRMAD